MFSLVIVAISIGLVALLAMVALYYGGSVWASQQVNATAATVNNQGTQYRAALMLYAEQNSGSYPAALSDLVPTYLASRPVPPKQAYTDESHEPAATDWGPGPNNSIGVWVRNQVSRAVCDTVNVQAGYIAEGIPRFVDPAKVVQCFQDATWVAATEGGDTTAPEKFTALYLIKAAPADICTAMSVENINCNPTGGTPVTVPPAGPTGGEPTCSAGTELVTGTGWFVSACRPPTAPSAGGGSPTACAGTEPIVEVGNTGYGVACVQLPLGSGEANATGADATPTNSNAGELTAGSLTCTDSGLCSVAFACSPAAVLLNGGVSSGGVVKEASVLVHLDNAADASATARCHVPAVHGYIVAEPNQYSYSATCPTGGLVAFSSRTQTTSSWPSDWQATFCVPALAGDWPFAGPVVPGAFAGGAATPTSTLVIDTIEVMGVHSSVVGDVYVSYRGAAHVANPHAGVYTTDDVTPVDHGFGPIYGYNGQPASSPYPTYLAYDGSTLTVNFPEGEFDFFNPPTYVGALGQTDDSLLRQHNPGLPVADSCTWGYSGTTLGPDTYADAVAGVAATGDAYYGLIACTYTTSGPIGLGWTASHTMTTTSSATASVPALSYAVSSPVPFIQDSAGSGVPTIDSVNPGSVSVFGEYILVQGTGLDSVTYLQITCNGGTSTQWWPSIDAQSGTTLEFYAPDVSSDHVAGDTCDLYVEDASSNAAYGNWSLY